MEYDCEETVSRSLPLNGVSVEALSRAALRVVTVLACGITTARAREVGRVCGAVESWFL